MSLSTTHRGRTLFLSGVMGLCAAASLAFGGLGAAPVLAQSPGGTASVNGGLSAAARGGGLGDFCNGGTIGTCTAVLVGGVVNVLLELSGIVLLGYILYAGFLWMTSGGESEKAKEARTMILNAVVGLIIVMTAFAISSFVLTALSNVSNASVSGRTSAAATPPPTTP